MMLGFSETEVREMIRYYQGVGALKAALHLIVVQIKGHSLYRMDEVTKTI